MATLPDLYSLLGIAHDASDDEIKRAYRRLARELHPDVSAEPNAERRFKEVTAAYETLSDPARRRQYDLFGQQGGAGQIPDFFSTGDFGDLFDVFFGGGMGTRRRARPRRTRARRGDDIAARLELTFEEAAFGSERDVEIETHAACERCGSSGAEPGTEPSRCSRCGGAGEVQEVARSIFGTVMTSRPCTSCDGTGEVISSPCSECGGVGLRREQRTIPINVPAGVADGSDLRVPGAGQAGRAGAPSGDLYVSLRVRPHPVFERRGQDLVCALVVPMARAALGTEIEIEGLDGLEKLRLEPGTQSGTVLRLRGRGVPNLGRRGRGDLFISVEVETPKPGSRDERHLLEQLAKLRGERPEKGRQAGRLRKLERD